MQTALKHYPMKPETIEYSIHRYQSGANSLTPLRRAELALQAAWTKMKVAKAIGDGDMWTRGLENARIAWAKIDELKQ